MKTYSLFTTHALLCLGLMLGSGRSGISQTATSTASSTLELQKVQIGSSVLDSIGSVAACQNFMALYAAVLKEQTGRDINTANLLAKNEKTTPCEHPQLTFDYLIVNFVDWNSETAVQPTSDWYLLSPDSPRSSHPQKFASLAELTLVTDSSKKGNRIFGSSRIGILLLHRNLPDIDNTSVQYSLTITHKKSVQAGDLSALISILNPGTAASAAELRLRANDPEDVLAVVSVVGAMPKLPDDLAFAGQAFLDKANKTKDTKPDATFNQTYDDEGYAHWDISAAIPVMGLKDIEYTQTGSTVTAKTVTRANAYGMVHWYPYPVDLKSDYPWIPSVVAGLPLSGKPLDKPFVGLAIGTKKPFPLQVNVFAGAAFNKVFTPASTTDATQLNSHRVTKLLYGIDVPIGNLVKAISGK